MNATELRRLFTKNPSLKVNVSTGIRKDILLSNDPTIIYEANLHQIKFKQMGGGVWQAYTEPYLSERQISKQ